MKTQTSQHSTQKSNVVSARGRARHTTDWFLYGTPRRINYDTATLAGKGDQSC